MFIDRGEAKGHIRNNHYDNNVNIEIEKKKNPTAASTLLLDL